MMKKVFLIVMLTALLNAAEGLSTLIEAAHQNELIHVYQQKMRSVKFSREAVQSSYLPQVDLGGSATFVDETGSIDVGKTYTASAKATAVIFDGFKRENLLDELQERIYATQSDLIGYKKTLSLQITQYYYQLLNLQGDIEAQQQNKKLLQQELERKKRFFDARIVTQEDVERINAALANADYEIEQLRYGADEIKAKLYTLTDVAVESLAYCELIVPQLIEPEELDSIRSLRYQSTALGYSAAQRTSSNLPTLTIQDTYSFYSYDDEPTAFPIDRVDQQNRLMLMLNMNILDFSMASKEKESVIAEKMALDSQIAYENKLSEANIALAKKAIERSKVLIRAAELALSASEKTFQTIEKKYHVNVVDYVKYLDALYQKSDAQAQFNTAKNKLQLAYAQYYYYAGLDIKEYLK